MIHIFIRAEKFCYTCDGSGGNWPFDCCEDCNGSGTVPDEDNDQCCCFDCLDARDAEEA